jgi:SLBB domain-containing protein
MQLAALNASPAPRVHVPHYLLMPSALSRRLLSFGLVCLVLGANRGFAQATTPTRPPTLDSRAALVARARAADSLGRTDESFLLHTRLRDGDFQVGDRILVSFEGLGLQRFDTLVVQDGKILHLVQPMGDLSVNGLLRFEVGDSISARAAKYFKDETVTTTPLVRLAVSGAVRAPGYYYARRDSPLGDVIMRSGGQDAAADLRNVVIKRGPSILWAKEDVMSALDDGLTIERLNLEPGDEIVVGSRAFANKWLPFVQYGIPLLSAILIPILIQRR